MAIILNIEIHLIMSKRADVPAIDHDDLVALGKAGDTGVSGRTASHPTHYHRHALVHPALHVEPEPALAVRQHRNRHYA